MAGTVAALLAHLPSEKKWPVRSAAIGNLVLSASDFCLVVARAGEKVLAED